MHPHQTEKPDKDAPAAAPDEEISDAPTPQKTLRVFRGLLFALPLAILLWSLLIALALALLHRL